jgi:phosphate transport system substrate-binding protein
MARAALLTGLVLLVAGCGGGKPRLVGAGSTLVGPLVARWADAYDGGEIVYSGIGSGGGLAQVNARTVDFGASDVPLATRRAGIVEIPWARTATVVAVNLPHAPRLDAARLAAIYDGRSRYWDEISPSLPHLRIAPLYRSDASGDTYVFTRYLYGRGVLERTWPAGTGERGNAGMTLALRQTPGAIAYVAAPVARAYHLREASIRLATYTYALVDRRSPQAAEVARFLRYAVGRGQAFARDLGFVPLPPAVRRSDLRLIAGLGG